MDAVKRRRREHKRQSLRPKSLCFKSWLRWVQVRFLQAAFHVLGPAQGIRQEAPVSIVRWN
jgi:hypothetical protein